MPLSLPGTTLVSRLVALLAVAMLLPAANALARTHSHRACAQGRRTCRAERGAVGARGSVHELGSLSARGSFRELGSDRVGTAAIPSRAPLTARQWQAKELHLFSRRSIFNAPVSGNVPLDSNSAPIVGNLVQQASTESLGIATTTFGVPIYIASKTQAPVYVTLDQDPPVPELQNAMSAVPLPPGAQAAAGTDGNLSVYQPSTDELWEFWRLHQDSDGSWHATWGGRLVHASSNPGYYQNMVDSSGNVLEQWDWGAPATSLALDGGVITIAELEAGTINHALALGITHTCAGVFAAPAQRTDGDVVGDPTCVPEGAHFRLNPSINLASLGLPHFTLMLAEAAQRYGIIINNRSSGFTFRAEDPTQFETEYGYNPYTGPHNMPGTPGALFDQWPSVLLHAFPWNDLQLVRMDLRTAPDMAQVIGTL